MTPAARVAGSIDLLREIADAPRRPADAVANAFFRERRFIGSGDRRAVSDRVWRVLRSHRRLAWWLERAGTAATPRMLVAVSLLMEGWTAAGVAQTYSGGQYGAAPLLQPESAAVRALEGHTGEHPEMPAAVRLEVPDWILPALEARFGAELVPEMAATLHPAPLDLRVNLLKGTREGALAALAAEGVEAAVTPYSPWGLRVDGRRSVTVGPAFQTGLVEIQDEGSQLVAALVGAGPEMRVVDWCAGAGGKTLALAMTMENRGHLVACDVSAPRLEGAVRRLRRAGVQNSERHLVEPGDKWAKRRAGTFDRVLVDAPCTGTGTWRRNPDARMRLREVDLSELVVKQAMILDAAARLVKPGGRLVYATCSLLGAENEDQIGAFLGRTPGFAVVPLERAWGMRGFGDGPYLSLTAAAAWDGRVLRGRAGAGGVIVRPARSGDAAAIGAVHVAAWRSAYAGLLPAGYLSGLSAVRHAAQHQAAIVAGHGVLVAEVERRVVGFCSTGRPRTVGLADGEVETLYVLDDHREQGVGRALLRAGARGLAGRGCGSVYLWVLEGNPSRWFYERLGGRPVRRAVTQVAGESFEQLAYVWDPIAGLLGES